MTIAPAASSVPSMPSLSPASAKTSRSPAMAMAKTRFADVAFRVAEDQRREAGLNRSLPRSQKALPYQRPRNAGRDARPDPCQRGATERAG